MSSSSSTEKEEVKQELYYESNRYQEREHCRECGSTTVYTRVYFHEKTNHSRWLCYCCADDYVQYRDRVPAFIPWRMVLGTGRKNASVNPDSK